MDRRGFIKKTGIITAGSLLVPSFLKANMFADGLSLKNKRLVVVQLSGGNDGLNTVVPYGMDDYYNGRSKLAMPVEGLHKIDEVYGFNQKLKGLFDLQQKGFLSIINSIGYPNPNRSHFRSMDIWHSASDSDKYVQTGWLGRYLDNYCDRPYQGIEFDGSLSLVMKGAQNSGIALTNPQAFYDTIHSDFFDELKLTSTKNEELDYLYKVFNDTKSSAEYIYDQYKLKTNNVEYAQSPFANKLKEISTLIKSDIKTPVFYTSLGGFDTHVNQLVSQDRLLEQLDGGVSSFVDDLDKNGFMDDTTIVIFSEFGRRLKENASRGTDHGKAGVLMVIDKHLNKKAHSYNQINLSDLDDGDPMYKIDFRRVYADVLENTLGVDSSIVLGKKFESLGLF